MQKVRWSTLTNFHSHNSQEKGYSLKFYYPRGSYLWVCSQTRDNIFKMESEQFSCQSKQVDSHHIMSNQVNLPIHSLAVFIKHTTECCGFFLVCINTPKSFWHGPLWNYVQCTWSTAPNRLQTCICETDCYPVASAWITVYAMCMCIKLSDINVLNLDKFKMSRWHKFSCKTNSILSTLFSDVQQCVHRILIANITNMQWSLEMDVYTFV